MSKVTIYGFDYESLMSVQFYKTTTPDLSIIRDGNSNILMVTNPAINQGNILWFDNYTACKNACYELIQADINRSKHLLAIAKRSRLNMAEEW